MYKMIIVDDEYYSREGIKNIIEWNDYGIEIIDSAKDGVEGIEKIVNTRPDIVITDIRMKSMNGLDMISKVRELGIDCKFIVMSGYKLFEYAKNALENGVDFYLLKPVPVDELIRVINTTKLTIEHEREGGYLTELDRWNKQFEDMLVTGVNHIIPAIIGSFYICKIRINLDGSITTIEKFYIYKFLLDLNITIKPYFQNSCELVLIIDDYNFKIKKILNFIKDRFNTDAVVGISNCYNNVASIFPALAEANTAISYEFYNDSIDRILFRDIENMTSDMCDEIFTLHTHIVNSIDNGHEDVAIIQAKNAFRIIKKEGYSPVIVQEWFRHLYMDINNLIARCDAGNLIRFRNMAFSSSILRYMDRASKHCIEVIEYASDIIRKSRNENMDNRISDIIAYIDRHFDEDISLEKLEKIFYIEASYIGKLIKKEVNTTYLSYITNVRIERSKELLASTQLHIYEISLSIGYSDVKYFTKLFKKQVGITCSEYRNRFLSK